MPLTLPVAISDTAELLAYALCGMEHIFQEGFRFKKAGVMLTELVPAQQIQLSLFAMKDRERSARLMTAMDDMNRQWCWDGPVCCYRVQEPLEDAQCQTVTPVYDLMGRVG